ncbi:MAG: hypothetical protein DYH13_08785 [Alphaproteobacteria bacterium PRO2]|nr:hypothetical protein [Alphaproteobacteria bacterium PRO2]
MAAPSLEQAIISLLMQESRPVRTKMEPALLFAGFLAVAGGGFLVAAGYDWLITNYDLQTARLVIGAGTMSLGIIIAAAVYSIYAEKRKQIEGYYSILKNNIHTALEVVGEELEEPIRENPKTAVMIASLAGYIAAEKLLH